MVHDAVAVRVRKELGAVAHDAAGRDLEFEVCGAAVAGTHVEQFCLSGAELFHDRADVVIRNFNHQKLHRLQFHKILILYFHLDIIHYFLVFQQIRVLYSIILCHFYQNMQSLFYLRV